MMVMLLDAAMERRPRASRAVQVAAWASRIVAITMVTQGITFIGIRYMRRTGPRTVLVAAPDGNPRGRTGLRTERGTRPRDLVASLGAAAPRRRATVGGRRIHVRLTKAVYVDRASRGFTRMRTLMTVVIEAYE